MEEKAAYCSVTNAKGNKLSIEELELGEGGVHNGKSDFLPKGRMRQTRYKRAMETRICTAFGGRAIKTKFVICRKSPEMQNSSLGDRV